MNLEKLKRYSPILLRTAIAIVFLWFGFSQLKDPSSWTGMLPEFAKSLSISPTTLIYISGSFEVILSIFLLLGIYTRISSFLLGLHLIDIITIVGYGPIGVRDFALALATFSIVLMGPDEFCLETIIRKKYHKNL
ncbi:MAG: DoxX family protein [Ignavibacteriaceae bacterium]|jgi:uncharacterized membrane protein YphA (DoxX/SURF4 family)|nr:DoxX family protein [Ignavibacteriaceae bacterium]